MDRLAAMSVFVAVIEAGSFSGAGRRLRMPVPTVSRKVAELESQLAARLLTRSTRTLALTEAGQNYLSACRRILEEVAAAERGASGEYREPRGALAITAPIVLGRLHVLPVVVEFLQLYPEVNVQLNLADRSLQLLDEHLDLAVRVGELPDSALVAIRIGTLRRVVCASPAYLSRRDPPRKPPDLVDHEVVDFTLRSGAESWSFGAARDEQRIPLRPRLVVNTAEAALDAAISGAGLTRVLSYQAAPAVKAGTLIIVLEEYEPAPVPVSLVFDRRQVLPLKLRAFLDFATPRLMSRLA
jgi:DNA-binding transcriptional LysR family regulator